MVDKINRISASKSICIESLQDELNGLTHQINKRLRLVQSIDHRVSNKKKEIDFYKQKYFQNNNNSYRMQKNQIKSLILSLYDQIQALSKQKIEIGEICKILVEREERLVRYQKDLLQKQEFKPQHTNTNINTSNIATTNSAQYKPRQESYYQFLPLKRDNKPSYSTNSIQKNNIRSELQRRGSQHHQIHVEQSVQNYSYNKSKSYNEKIIQTDDQAQLKYQYSSKRDDENSEYLQNEDQTLFCVCRRPANYDSNMIACDNPKGCKILWFHVRCVITDNKIPEGEWLCQECSQKMMLSKKKKK